MSVTREEMLEILVHDLPRLVSEQPELRYALVEAMAETFARQDELHAVLAEIRALREDFNSIRKTIWQIVLQARQSSGPLGAGAKQRYA